MTSTGKISSPEQKLSIASPMDDDDHTPEHARKSQSFPRKLRLLLEHSENTNNRIISWFPDGKSFRVHQKENFTGLVMPEFFHPSTYKSFERNLTMWGFRTVSKGPIKGALYHPSFQRGKPQLCQTMNRAKAKDAGAQDNVFVDCLSGLPKRNRSDEEEAVPASFTSFEKDTTRKENPLKEINLKRQRTEIIDDSCSETSSSSEKANIQIQAHQAEQWYERFKELVEFQRDHGHCVVPYHFNQNLPLALWVKRQRTQYKLKKEGQHSTMNDDRETALETLGFAWDSHKAVWQERLNELIAFRNEKGNCNVPAKFAENPQLAIWVKCQRRQYKLYNDGERSNMTAERIEKLTDELFVWNPRRVK